MENKGENKKDTSFSSHGSPDTFMHVISLRTEKILSALYMVTECMEGEDPIKQKVRTLGVEMVAKVRSIAMGLPTEKHLLFREVFHTITMMTGYLSVARTIGFISEMNYSILNAELRSVGEAIDKNISHIATPISSTGKGFNLPENFFLTEELSTPQFPEQFSYKGHFKDNNNVLKNVQYDVGYTPKPRFQSIGQNTQINKFPKVKIDRKKIIIETVTQKENVMIKDVIPLFTDCSEKTIQRELSDLVSQGILKKTGDKRWSKYSLSRSQ